MTPKEMITVEKEVYEAVLINSVRVNDLEAENHKLKEINLWHSEKSWDCEREKQQLKELLKEWREHLKDTKCGKCQNLIRRTDNAIGENK